MKDKNRIYFVFALLMLTAASSLWAADPPKPVRANAAAIKPAAVQSAPVPASIDWPHYGNGYDNDRYQNVDLINTKNVGKMKVAWVFHTGVLDQFGSLQVSPIVINGVMFVTDGHDDVFALNAATGTQIWAVKPTDLPSLETLPLCCGRNNRGVAVGGGRVYYGRLDNVVVA